MPDAGTFQWRFDIGQSSTNGIEALARSSGVPFTVTDSYRPGDPGYHGSQNAEDLSSSTESMAQLATYLYQYSPYLLELIHSDQNQPGGGWFVKNGRRVDANYYGAKTVSEHYNHVHVATTLSALQAASIGELVITDPSAPAPATQKKAGCLPAAATAMIIPLLTLGGYLWRI